MKPPHWWLGVPRLGRERADRDWVVYPMLAGALLLLFLVWASGWARPTTARADLDGVHPPRVRATGATSDRAIGASDASVAKAGAAPVQSLRLPETAAGRETAAPSRPRTPYLARFDDLGAVTGDRTITLDAAALGGAVGGASGGESGYGFADRVLTRERPEIEEQHTYISTGYGIGGGGGGAGGARTALPSVQIGKGTCTPAGSDPIVRRYLRRNLPRLTYCYEKQLLTSPLLAGTVDTSFLIERDGTVSAVTAEGVDPTVSSCMADVIQAIELPAMSEPTSAAYPITMRPRGG